MNFKNSVFNSFRITYEKFEKVDRPHSATP